MMNSTGIMKCLSVLCLLLGIVASAQGLTTDDVSILMPVAQATSQNNFIFIIPDRDPYYGILAASVACSYPLDDEPVLYPLLVYNTSLTQKHQSFLAAIANQDTTILCFGDDITISYPTLYLEGTTPEISVQLAQQFFPSSQNALILKYSASAYTLNLLSSPLASYSPMPILLYDENDEALRDLLTLLGVETVYSIGDVNLTLPSHITQLHLQSADDIQQQIVSVIKQRFSSFMYLTLTNPSDIIPLQETGRQTNSSAHNLKHFQLTTLSRSYTLRGSDTILKEIYIPKGLYHLNINASLYDSSSIMNTIPWIKPLLTITLYDAKGDIAGYSFSQARDYESVKVETLICNASGNYTIELTMYHGVKGGFFLQRGLSIVDATVTVTTTLSELSTPHYPLIPKLSMLAPYITSARGGLIIADESFSLTDTHYVEHAQGTSAGPWFQSDLHVYNNQKVQHTLGYINDHLLLLDQNDLLSLYLEGPSWLALLGDTNMLPMYYYGPSQDSIYERGLPSDNPYSVNNSLSTGRVIAYDVTDLSLLISRTLFYKDICGNPSSSDDWHNRFHFVFGEGFGETGGLFHQIPYSRYIQSYGFHTEIYGNGRNSRNKALAYGTYHNANFIEYLGHGDWFQFTPAFYGRDIASRAIDVASVKDWVFEKPNVFLSSACLMGRVDGLPPQMNIGLTFIHAGSNAFIGATRLTGREAGLEPLENHLIFDDFSLGEALRGLKQVNQEPPSYYVRTLYGDPAFNPYDPLHGFSNQGRPLLR